MGDRGWEKKDKWFFFLYPLIPNPQPLFPIFHLSPFAVCLYDKGCFPSERRTSNRGMKGPLSDFR